VSLRGDRAQARDACGPAGEDASAPAARPSWFVVKRSLLCFVTTA
jgi:hypothetical protein